MPAWVETGYQEYVRRFPAHWQWSLTEIPLANRSRTTRPEDAVQREEKMILKRLSPGACVVALEVNGRSYSTRGLSEQLPRWTDGSPLVFLIGGPDGLGEGCRRLAHQQWSLSDLTLPHPLVRVILVEQLYRAWSLLQGHPYHRE